MLSDNYLKYEKKIISKINRFELSIKDHNELKKDFKNSKILIVGAAGSIGSALVKAILNYDFSRLILVDKNENDLTELNRKINLKNIKRDKISKIVYICNDLTSCSINDTISKYKISHYLNFAALKHVRSEENIDSIKYMFLTNSKSFIDEKNMSKLRTLKKLFSISTDKAVNPSSLLGLSKVFMEQKLAQIKKRSSLFVSTARFANVSFSNGSILKNIVDKINEKKILGIPRNIKRYFITHEEACSICLSALLTRNDGFIVVPSLKIIGKQKSIKHLCDKICAFMGIRPKYVYKKKKNDEILDKKNRLIVISSGKNHGQKKEEELFSIKENVEIDAKNKSITKIKLVFNKDYNKLIKQILEELNYTKIKSILSGKVKFFKPTKKTHKISAII